VVTKGVVRSCDKKMRKIFERVLSTTLQGGLFERTWPGSSYYNEGTFENCSGTYIPGGKRVGGVPITLGGIRGFYFSAVGELTVFAM